MNPQQRFARVLLRADPADVATLSRDDDLEQLLQEMVLEKHDPFVRMALERLINVGKASRSETSCPKAT